VSLLDSDSDSENSVNDYAIIDTLMNSDDNEEMEIGVCDRFQMGRKVEL
jgi:hypothetical protein